MLFNFIFENLFRFLLFQFSSILNHHYFNNFYQISNLFYPKQPTKKSWYPVIKQKRSKKEEEKTNLCQKNYFKFMIVKPSKLYLFFFFTSRNVSHTQPYNLNSINERERDRKKSWHWTFLLFLFSHITHNISQHLNNRKKIANWR